MHKLKCEEDKLASTSSNKSYQSCDNPLIVWDNRFDFFAHGKDISLNQFINCHAQVTSDDPKEKAYPTNAEVFAWAEKNSSSIADEETKKFALALQNHGKDADIDAVGHETGLNGDDMFTALKVLIRRGSFLGVLCQSGDSNMWQQFKWMLEDVQAECIASICTLKNVNEQVAEKIFLSELTQTSSFPMMKWFESTVGTVDDMFENCFYFKNTSYLYHFLSSEDAVTEKVLDGAMKNNATEMMKLVLDGEFVEGKPEDMKGKTVTSVNFKWQKGSMMDQANKMGLIFKGHYHLASLCCLFMAPKEIRRDYAALYRTWRIVKMSIIDGNSAMNKQGKNQKKMAGIQRHLDGVLGCDKLEEQTVGKATDVIYHNCNDEMNTQERSIVVGGRESSVTRNMRESLMKSQEHRKSTGDLNASMIEAEFEGDSDKRAVRLFDRNSAFICDLLGHPCPQRQDDERDQELPHKTATDDGGLQIEINTLLGASPFNIDKVSSKVDFYILDNILVAANKKYVDFSQNENAVADYDASQDVIVTPRTLLNGKNEEHDEVVASVLPLHVITASLTLPLSCAPEEFLAPNGQKVIRLVGRRFVEGELKKRDYYFGIENVSDHDELLKVLSNRCWDKPQFTAENPTSDNSPIQDARAQATLLPTMHVEPIPTDSLPVG